MNESFSGHRRVVLEEWRAIPEWEGFYEASNLGRVRSVARVLANGKRRIGKVLSPGRGKLTAHRHVILCKNGERKMYGVHKAVLEAFVGPCPEGMEACHNDGNPENNHTTNLRWGTPASNMQDRIRHGNNPQINKVHCPRLHLLQAPNLTRFSVKRGWRSCLACSKAHKQVEDFSSTAFQGVSDLIYAEIMREANSGT